MREEAWEVGPSVTPDISPVFLSWCVSLAAANLSSA